MANLAFSLRSVFGLIPSTEKIESLNQSLKDEYEKLNTYKESDELKEYLNLKEYIESDDFKNTKKNILALNFKNSEEYQKEARYVKLKKNKNIINYFNVIDSSELSEFNKTELSEELNTFLELQEYLKNKDHIDIVSELDLNLKNEIQKEKNFKLLDKSKNVKSYFKIVNSNSLKNYSEIDGSTLLEEFNELKDFCSSQNLLEFKKAITEQLIAEKNKTKELKKLKKHPEIKAYNKSNDEDKTKPDELIQLEELNIYINSNDYKTKLEGLIYKNTEEYKKEIKFKQLSKNKKLKDYFKFVKSSQFNHYNTYKDSDELKQYEELKEYISSDQYQNTLSKYTYKKSDEYQKELQFEELKKSDKIVNWLKYQKLKPYLLFKEVENSELLTEFQDLEDFINSDKFKEFKEYMLDKDKWQKTDDFQKETKFNELNKSEEVKWYYIVKDSNKFNELKSWNITFEDDFTTKKIEEDKWINSYFWGKMLLNDRYVMAGDKHFYTDNNNIEINGTSIKIVTKQEKTQGKVWHPVHGFSTQDFNYTSGMLSTAHSFRQLYGRIEAKVKLNSEFPVYQAFWLKGEKILPEIDVFKFNMDKKHRFQMSSIWGDANDSKNAKRKTDKLSGTNFTKDYFIYTLDWTENKLIWKINGIEVFSTTQGIPNEPLFLILSAGLQHEPNQDFNEAAFEIDWVRCYEKA